MKDALLAAALALCSACAHASKPLPPPGNDSLALSSAKRDLAQSDRQREADAEKLIVARIGRQDAEDKAVIAEQDTAAAKKQTAIVEAKNKKLEAALATLAEFRTEGRGLVLTLSSTVLFSAGDDRLLVAAQPKLDEVVRALLADEHREILVEGYTDSPRDNQALSQRRADAVRSYIISRGYPSAKIRAAGLGRDYPVASSGTVQGRADNRRVEIVVLAQ